VANPVTDTLTSWEDDAEGADSNQPTNVTRMDDGQAGDLDGELRLLKSEIRKESLNKSWERWLGKLNLAGTADIAFTYVSATSFTVNDNLTSASRTVAVAGRRVKATIVGSTLYGTIASAVWTSITTVTVVWDSGSLDASLSEVQFGPELRATIAIQSWGSRGQTSKNNPANPNTQYDLDADQITLRHATLPSYVITAPGAAITNNVGLSGPIINGRDQGAAFTPSSWLHLYWIWDGTTLATVSSQTAPPTGPTLPTNYTHWSYAGAIFFGAGSTLAHIYIRGNTAYYDAQASVISGQHANTTEITLSLAAFIPPNAQSFLGHVMAAVGATGGGSTAGTVTLRFITGSDVLSVRPHTSVASGFGTDSMAFEMPNISQQMFYLWTDESAFVFARTLNISIVGYRLPNGGA
jgi:hypothetical protein